MNIVFFGSSHFAIPSLAALLGGKHTVLCVVTQPDKQKGRGLLLGATEVKVFAQGANLKIYQPADINSNEPAVFLRNLNPDLFAVVAYGQILSVEVLNIPKIFSLNIHASLLPQYRGAAPINRALINGERQTGVSAIKMAKKMDAGPILSQESIDIEENDNALTLEDKLSKVGADLLTSAINAIENNNYELKPQDETKATFAPGLKKEDGEIAWDKPAGEIFNLIRGCAVWPGAFTYWNGKMLKIYKAALGLPVSGLAGLPGQIIEVSKKNIIVASGKGNLVIDELQIEGGRRMQAGEFIAGRKIKAGGLLGKK